MSDAVLEYLDGAMQDEVADVRVSAQSCQHAGGTVSVEHGIGTVTPLVYA
ncbi:hypothetical protein [Streptomyces sp. NPDC001286]